MAGGRVTDGEILRRVDLCTDLLIKGWIPYKIALHVAKMKDLREGIKKDLDQCEEYDDRFDWNVCQRQVYEYCHKAQDTLQVIKEKRVTRSWNMSVARYSDLIRRAIDSGNLGEARLAQKELDKLLGVHEFGAEAGDPEATKSEIRLPDGTLIEL